MPCSSAYPSHAETSPTIPPVLRIAIVNPDHPCSIHSLHHTREVIGGPVRTMIQTGALPTLAGLLDPRHDIQIFDETVAPLDLDHIATFDVIGVTGMIAQKSRLIEILTALRVSRGTVVLGGPLVTAEEHLFTELCDVVFIGEADETWPVFIEDLAHGRPTARRYQQAERTDMARVPVPRFDLLDTKRYETVSIQFSRGCPFLCEFCDIIVMFGRRPRTKPVAHMLAEITAAHAAGYRSCFVVDDNFIGNKVAAKELLRALIEWQKAQSQPMNFATEASVNLAEDEELLSLMVAAGFTQVFIGIESPDPAALLETRKVQNVRCGPLLDRLDRIRHAGLIIRGGFIVGFDADGPGIFDAQFDFITRAAIAMPVVSILSPLPTTPLHARMEKEGRLVPEDTLCGFEPLQMSRATLKAGARRLIARLFDPDNFFDRVFRSFEGPESYRDRLSADRARRRAASSPAKRRDTRRMALRLARVARREGHPEVIAAYMRNWRKNCTLGRVQLPQPEFLRLCVMHWHLYLLAHGDQHSNWYDQTTPVLESA